MARPDRTTLRVNQLNTPIGELRIAYQDTELVAVAFADGWDRAAQLLARRLGPFVAAPEARPSQATLLLERYFAGELNACGDMTPTLIGTPFQHNVWRAICAIPAGETATYYDLAVASRSPRAVRAVGSACGANLLAIVVPCHRVVSTGGAIGNYGAGPERKRWLLDHERRCSAHAA